MRVDPVAESFFLQKNELVPVSFRQKDLLCIDERVSSEYEVVPTSLAWSCFDIGLRHVPNAVSASVRRTVARPVRFL